MVCLPRKLAIPALAALAAFLLRCVPGNLTGGSEIGNPSQVMVRGQVRYDGSGAPVASAIVHLRPLGYLKDTGSATTAATSLQPLDTVTDDAGYFTFSKVDTGKYRIEVNDHDSNGTLIPCYATGPSDSMELPLSILKPTASLSGRITNLPADGSVSAFVQVYGLERLSRVDPATGNFTVGDLPAGTYSLRIITTSPTFAPRQFDNLSVSAGAPVSVGPVILSTYGLWSHSQRLYIVTTATGAGITGSVTNFPLLVRLRKTNFPFAQALPSGQDLRFAKSDNSPLSFEIERWDASQGLAEVWVALDTVYGNDATQYITMYWGNSSVAHASNGEAVFDTARGFTGVWHLSEAPGGAGSIFDRTRNHFNGTPAGMAGAQPVEGVIGTCLNFDGSNDFITLPTITTDFTRGLTICGWMNYRQFKMWSRLIDLCESGGRTNGIMIGNMGESPDLEFNIWNSDTGQGNPLDKSAYFALDQWIFVSATYDGRTMTIYKNGSSLGSRAVAFPLLNVPRTTSYIGTSNWPLDSLFSGQIDELQISHVARSATWIKLSYQTQKVGSAVIKLGQ